MTTCALRTERNSPYFHFSRSGERCDETNLPYSWQAFDTVYSPRPKNFDVPFSAVLKQAKQLSLFVEIDDDVLSGMPRMDNSRIPVYMVLSAIEEYGTIEGATRAYRSLTIEQVRDALKFAIHVLESPFEHESTHTY